MDLATLFFGMFIPIFVITVAKAVKQTRSIFRKTGTLHNSYLYLVWGEALANVVFAVSTYLFIQGAIKGALWYYIFAVTLWGFQVQLLPQIIANRVALIMTNRRKAQALKWALAVPITMIIVAVYYIWVNAHLDGATPAQIRLNFIFEKVEKSFFLIVDLALNLYFLYLVKSRLISAGLSKYWRLFNVNIGMVVISTSLDALLLGFLGLSDPYIYVQFAPLAYITKLYIELIMARLISKVVRSSGNGADDDAYSRSWNKSNPRNHNHNQYHGNGSGPGNAYSGETKRGSGIMSKLGNLSGKHNVPTTVTREGSSGSDIYLASYHQQQTQQHVGGITKTIETTVQPAESTEEEEEEEKVKGKEKEKKAVALGLAMSYAGRDKRGYQFSKSAAGAGSAHAAKSTRKAPSIAP